MAKLLLLLLALSLPAAATARADDDHARAHAAREAGRIVALESIVAAAEQRTGGVVLDVELEDETRDEGRWVYEVKALAADGRIVKLEYDATTGALLREKRKR